MPTNSHLAPKYVFAAIIREWAKDEGPRSSSGFTPGGGLRLKEILKVVHAELPKYDRRYPPGPGSGLPFARTRRKLRRGIASPEKVTGRGRGEGTRLRFSLHYPV